MAASNLAFMYWDGKSVDVDLDQAEALFEDAVARGFERAADHLEKLRAERGESAETAIYYFAESGAPVGPLTLTQMETAVNDGRFDGSTLVWREGMEDWVAANTIAEIADLLPQ